MFRARSVAIHWSHLFVRSLVCYGIQGWLGFSSLKGSPGSGSDHEGY